MRPITEIIIHCTATPEGRAVTVADIDKWHKANGWNGIGYHYVIGLNGEIWAGRNIEIAGAHTLNHNQNSIGVVYAGGTEANDIKKSKDTRTSAQKSSLIKIISELKQKFPNAKIYGHRDFNATACPGFDAKTEYQNL